MKREVWTLALLAALPITLAEGVPAQAAPAQTKINKCPYVITAPGSYLVQKNLSCVLTAITISASNVDLDLGGHTISGSGTGDGVYVQGQSNVSIHDGGVQGFVIGVELQRTLDGKITNVTASQNRDSGIATGSGTAGLTVMGCTANQNRNNGVIFGGDSRSNTVTNSTMTLNAWGITICCGAFANTVANNTANGNVGGISLGDTSFNTVTGNTASGNNCQGIDLWNTRQTTVSGNTIDQNGCFGIMLHGNSFGNTVGGNSLTANNNEAIDVFDNSSQNTIQDNTITGTTGNGTGIEVGRGPVYQNTLQRNRVTLNIRGDRTGSGCQLQHHPGEHGQPEHPGDRPGRGRQLQHRPVQHGALQPRLGSGGRQPRL
jgi:parallel beta-helix repeat protein